MGFRSWLRDRSSRRTQKRAAPNAETPSSRAQIALGCPADEWEEVPPYLPVDPAEHLPACIIASALAAGSYEKSKLVVRRVNIANPEHRRVAAIATALGAGALDKSSFTVKRIYKKLEQKGTENEHAA